jgi:hypothetical protein
VECSGVGVLLCGSHDSMMSLVRSNPSLLLLLLLLLLAKSSVKKVDLRIVEIKVIVVQTF